MAQPIDDRWLWLGLGIAAFIAVRGMRRSIQDTVRLIEVPNPTERNNDDRSEEGSLTIPLDAFKTLANSPNYMIRDHIIEVVLENFTCSDHYDDIYASIERDSRSNDEDLARKAKQTIRFLHEKLSIGPSSSPSEAAERESNGSSSSSSSSETNASLEQSGSEAEMPPEPRSALESTRRARRAQLPVAGWTAVPRESLESAEGAEVRRNRREAIVLHEGAGGVEESDIIRPQH